MMRIQFSKGKGFILSVQTVPKGVNSSHFTQSQHSSSWLSAINIIQDFHNIHGYAWLRLHQLANEITHLNEENHNTSFQPPSQSHLLLFVLDDVSRPALVPPTAGYVGNPLQAPIWYFLMTSDTNSRRVTRLVNLLIGSLRKREFCVDIR